MPRHNALRVTASAVTRSAQRVALAYGPVFAPLLAVRPPLRLALGAGIGALLIRQRRESQRSRRLAAAALETLLNAIDANDAVTGAHVRRVAANSMTLARAAHLDESTIRSVERVALFHDIGKIHEALFDIVHDHDSEVTPEERRLIASHPQRGAEVLQPLSFFYPDLPEGVLAHHERWDGSGYPHGLAGEDIPIQARVVSIADTFDAITHRRPYRRAHSFDDGVRAIADGSDTQFDPLLVEVFLAPHVLARVRRIAERSGQPQVTSGNGGRRHREEAKVADVTFRWRDKPLAPPS
jgi:HD-GYP domain-containing protein (c-di-GMP phosphodiesterase class II)